MEGLRIKVLGGIQVQLGGETIEFSRQKATALLVFLAVTGERQPRDALATMFWPENNQSRAYANLRQAIWEIRRSLGDHWLEVTRYSLEMISRDNLWLDIEEFHDLIIKVKNHVHPRGMVCENCLANYKQAVALFNGDFLAGFSLRDSPEFDNWQYFQTEELRREIGRIYQQLAEWFLQKQDYGQAIAYAQRWLQLDELNENAHRGLMRIYYASGQRSAAIQQYKNCVSSLKRQLNITPEPKTTELNEKIQSDSLRFETRPREDLKPLAGSTLPVPITPFVGRIDEIAALSHLILNPNIRLLTILAPGGMGKSRLAIEIARKLMPHFEDGVLFVPLSPLETSEMFISYFANAIGYIRTEGQPLNQQLKDYFQEKSLLLVLDNLEHLTNMSHWIRDLLANSPNLKILATSRLPLNIKAETRFHLGGLNFPEEGTTEDLSAFSAVKLFLRSAHRVKPLFIPAEDDWQYIGEICRLVEGMPLAIEMAASWLEMLSLPEIVKEIRRGLAFFDTHICDIPERQHSLYAVFDYSWKSLDKKERTQFSQLTIFRGGFTREAAEKVVGISLRQLVGLVNRSILNRTPEDRFEIHELLRQYGFEKLQTNLAGYQHLITRYAEYYCNKLGALNEDLKTGKLRRALTKTSADFENIHQAWEVALHFERLDLIETSLGGLIMYFDHSFRDDEGLALFEEAAENISDETRQGVRILSLLTGYLVWLNLSLGNYEQGEKKFRESITLMHRLEPIQTREERFAQAFHLFLRGIYNRFQGDLSVFKKLFLQSINLFKELGEDWWCERIYRFLGNAAWTGKMASDTIDVYYQKALKIARSLNDHYGMARTLEFLGVFCAYSKGDLQKAESYFRESSRIFLELDDGYSYIRYNICLEQIANINGRFQEVLELRQKRLHFLEKSGDPTSISVAYMELGETYHHIGDYASAEMNGWRAVKGKGGLKDIEVRSRWFLGLTLIAKKDYQQANFLLSEALKISCELTEEPELAGSLAALTRIEIANGNHQIAERLLIEGLEEAITAGFPFNMLYILASAALLLAVRGDSEKALEVYALVHSWHFVSNSVWFSDVYKEPLLSLSGTKEIIVKERQNKDTLWQMAESLLVELKQA